MVSTILGWVLNRKNLEVKAAPLHLPLGWGQINVRYPPWRPYKQLAASPFDFFFFPKDTGAYCGLRAGRDCGF